MTISRTLYIFKFLVKFSDVHYFCIKCKYHISKILLRIATKRARITPQILLTTKSTVFTLKILLLASKPTGHLVPRCRNNVQLCHTTILSMNWMEFEYRNNFACLKLQCSLTLATAPSNSLSPCRFLNLKDLVIPKIIITTVPNLL